MADLKLLAGTAHSLITRGVGLTIKAAIVSTASRLDVPASAIRVSYGKGGGQWGWMASVVEGGSTGPVDDPLTALADLL